MHSSKTRPKGINIKNASLIRPKRQIHDSDYDDDDDDDDDGDDDDDDDDSDSKIMMDEDNG